MGVVHKKAKTPFFPIVNRDKAVIGGGMRKNRLLFAGVLVSIAALMSCGGNLRVVELPRNAKVISVENDKLTLTYHFNMEVKQRSVILNTTFFVSTNKVDSIPGIITFPDSRTLRFVSALPLREMLPAGGGKIMVRMVGTSPFKEWVSDMNDNPIDGDRKAGPGGDFRAEYDYKF